MEAIKTRSLNVIAREIKTDWTKVYFGAVPYLQAMETLNSINDSFGNAKRIGTDRRTSQYTS